MVMMMRGHGCGVVKQQQKHRHRQESAVACLGGKNISIETATIAAARRSSNATAKRCSVRMDGSSTGVQRYGGNATRVTEGRMKVRGGGMDGGWSCPRAPLVAEIAAAASAKDGGEDPVPAELAALAVPAELEALAADKGSDGGSRSRSKREDGDIDWLMTVLLFVFPALGGMLFGYDIGATSGALLSMTSADYSGTDWYDMSPLLSGLVVSLSLGGALVGSVLALVFGDAMGRKKELLTAGGLYGLGALMVSQAPGLPLVLAGRLAYGVGIGFGMHAAPAYIAETAPPRVRGILISLKEALIVSGILLGYYVSYVEVSHVGGWRTTYLDAVPLALLLLLGMSLLPESPRWLLLSGRGEDSFEALKKVKGKTADDASLRREIQSIVETLPTKTLSSSAGAGAATTTAAGGGGRAHSVSPPFDLSEVLSPKYRKPLLIGVSLMLFQQITGQPSVLYYAGKIFQDAGFSSADDATGISVILGVFKLVMTGIAVVTVDSWGRRPLLLLGVSGIVGSLCLLGSIQSGALLLPSSDAQAWTNVGALLLYVGAYQVSFGPVSWLIVGEVFPLSIRGQALALATLTNFAANFGVSLLIPSLQERFGPSGECKHVTPFLRTPRTLGTINFFASCAL